MYPMHLEVHGELVLGHPAELEDDAVEVLGRHQLKVLDARHGHPPVKIQHVGSNLGPFGGGRHDRG